MRLRVSVGAVQIRTEKLSSITPSRIEGGTPFPLPLSQYLGKSVCDFSRWRRAVDYQKKPHRVWYCTTWLTSTFFVAFITNWELILGAEKRSIIGKDNKQAPPSSAVRKRRPVCLYRSANRNFSCLKISALFCMVLVILQHQCQAIMISLGYTSNRILRLSPCDKYWILLQFPNSCAWSAN